MRKSRNIARQGSFATQASTCFRVMCLLFVQKGAGIVVVTSMDGGRIETVGKHVFVGGEGDAQGRCGTEA